MSYFELDSKHTDHGRIRKERGKAQKLKNSQWWINVKNQGVCHYCQKKVSSKEITMDHLIPLARGGNSTKGNLIPSCVSCNQSKGLKTPVDILLSELEQ